MIPNEAADDRMAVSKKVYEILISHPEVDKSKMDEIIRIVDVNEEPDDERLRQSDSERDISER